jgi:hypothetical protein
VHGGAVPRWRVAASGPQRIAKVRDGRAGWAAVARIWPPGSGRLRASRLVASRARSRPAPGRALRRSRRASASALSTDTVQKALSGIGGVHASAVRRTNPGQRRRPRANAGRRRRSLGHKRTAEVVDFRPPIGKNDQPWRTTRRRSPARPLGAGSPAPERSTARGQPRPSRMRVHIRARSDARRRRSGR